MRHIDICYVNYDKLRNQHGDSYKNAHFAYQQFFHLNVDFLFGKIVCIKLLLHMHTSFAR